MTPIYFAAEVVKANNGGVNLASIGLVSEAGAKFYAEFNDFTDGELIVGKRLNESILNRLIWNDEKEYEVIHEFMREDNIWRQRSRKHCNIEVKNNADVIKCRLIYWLKNEYENADCKTLQFYADNYTYTFAPFIDFLRWDTSGVIPDIISIHPVDLSTFLQIHDIAEPDIDRDKLLDVSQFSNIRDHLFDSMVDHRCNALWKALVTGHLFHETYHQIDNKT